MMAADQKVTLLCPARRRSALAGRARRAGEAVRLPGSARAATRVTLGASRRGKAVVPAAGVELAQLAELDSETVTIAIAAVVGLAAGLGVPIFFVIKVFFNPDKKSPDRTTPSSNLHANSKNSLHLSIDHPPLPAHSFFLLLMQEERDKERLEEIRELNRATLKATGEQMSEEEIAELRPSRYLDRREFKDDDSINTPWMSRGREPRTGNADA